jgi:hypothetical protein
MNAVFCALLIWSLPFVGASCGSASVQQTSGVEKRPASTVAKDVVVLTIEHPTGSFKIERALLERPPEVLEISVTKVVNPTASPVDIFVYVSAAAENEKTEPEKQLVGTFSLYPADRPGKFMLSPAAAFRKFSETSKSSSAELLFEMKVGTENKAPVEVTIEKPNGLDNQN